MFLGRRLYPTVPLYTQVYKWVLVWGVALQWTSIVEIFFKLVASWYRNQDKLWPDGPLGSYADIALHGLMLQAPYNYR